MWGSTDTTQCSVIQHGFSSGLNGNHNRSTHILHTGGPLAKLFFPMELPFIVPQCLLNVEAGGRLITAKKIIHNSIYCAMLFF